MMVMTCDNGGGGPWSDLTHDVLFLVMMQLGVIDFVAFSGVCKSWRSFAFSYMNTFMASRPPMFMTANEGENDKWCCHLKDADERRFKTALGHSVNAFCVGITCGYVILFERKTNDFWLVNLITRHELHFPNAPINAIYYVHLQNVRGTLVFSPSIYGGLVFVVLYIDTTKIWISRGEGAWNCVTSTIRMIDLQFFKGKIYTLQANSIFDCKTKFIGVMKLDPKESKITLLETKNFPSSTRPDFVCSAENIYVLKTPSIFNHLFKVYKLDFGEMKWVEVDENTSQQNAFFLCYKTPGAIVKPEPWWNMDYKPLLQVTI